MPNKYWVGGTATWDGTAGTKWSLTSGGTGGASVPSATDDVFFDGNSSIIGGPNVTVTIAGGSQCKSLDFTGFSGGKIVGGGAANTYLFIYGSLTLSNKMLIQQGVLGGILLYAATGTNNTVTCAGQTIPWQVFFGYGSTSGGNYICTDVMRAGSNVLVRYGNVTFNGGDVPTTSLGPISVADFTYTSDLIVGGYLNCDFSGPRSITANSIEIKGANGFTSSATTLTANIGKLFFTGPGCILTSDNTFNDVYFFSGGTAQTGTGNTVGATFNNIYVSGSSTNISFRQCTINNSLDFTYSTGDFNMTTSEVITLKGNLILSSASAFKVTQGANLLFNNTSASSTITSNGKVYGLGNIEVNGGTLNLNDKFSSTGSITLTAGTLNCNSASGISSSTPDVKCYSFITSGSLSRTLYIKPNAVFEVTYTTNAAAASPSYPWNISSLAGMTLNATGSYIKITGTNGTTYPVICKFGDNVTYAGTPNPPTPTFPVVDLTKLSKTNANINYGTIWFNRTNLGSVNYVLGSNFFEDFWDGNPTTGSNYGVPAHTLAFEQNKIQVFKNFNVNTLTGITGARITLDSCNNTGSTLATGQHYLCSLSNTTLPTLSPTSNTVNLKTLTIKHSAVTPSWSEGQDVLTAKWVASSSILDITADPTTGWYGPVNKYWVGGAGTWDLTTKTNWSDSSGGSGGADVPTIDNNIIFDANSGIGVVTVANLTTIACKSINFTGFKGTFSSNALTTPIITITATGGTNASLNFGSTIDTWTDLYKGTFVLVNTSNTDTFGITTAGRTLQSNVTIGTSTGSTSQSYTFNNFFKTLNTGVLNITSGAVTFSGTSGLYNASVGQIILNTAASTKSVTALSGIELTGGGATAATNVNVWQGDGANTNTALTLNVPNIYVTNTTLLGGSYVNGNTTVPFKNLYFNASGTIVGTNTAMVCDNIFVSSASPKITFNTTTVNGSVDFTGSTGKWDQGTLTNVLTISKNLTLVSGLTVTKSSNLTLTTPSGQTSVITLSGSTPSAWNKTLTNPVIISALGTVNFNNVTTNISNTLTLNSGTLSYRNLSATGLTINGGALDTDSSYFMNLGTGTITNNVSNFSIVSILTCGYLNGVANNVLVLYSPVTLTGAASINITASNAQLIFNNLLTTSGTIALNNATSALVFTKFVNSSSGITFTKGSLYIEDNIKCTTFIVASDAGAFKYLEFTNGSTPITIELTGFTTSYTSSVWSVDPYGFTTPPILNNNLTIKLTSTNNVATNYVVFDGRGLSYDTVWWNREGTTTANYIKGNGNTYKLFKDGNEYISGTPTTNYNILAHTDLFDINSTSTFDNFKVSGSSSTKVITLSAATTGQPFSFISTNLNAEYINCYFLNIIGNAANFVGGAPPTYIWVAYSSVLGTGTTGWKLVNSRYWVPGGDGNWGSSSNWSTKSAGAGGTGGSTPPTATDVAIFDAYSSSPFTPTTPFNVNVNVAATCLNLKFTGDDGLSNSYAKLIGTLGITIGQGLALSPNMDLSGYTGTMTFNGGSGTYAIVNNGKQLNSPVVFTATADDAIWNVSDYFNSLKSVTLNRGILNFNGANPTVINGVNYSATMSQLISNGALARTIKALNLELTGGGATLGTNFNCWDTSTATAGLTNNVTNIYITGTSLGRKWVAGNATYTLGNIWFYGIAEYIGIATASKTGDIYVRSVGATASAVKFTIFTGSIIGSLDFTGSKVDWSTTWTGITLTGNLKLAPNFTATDAQDLLFTPPANSTISIFANGWNPGGSIGIYPATITVNAPSTTNVNCAFGCNAFILNSGKLNFGPPYDPTWGIGILQTNAFTINGGSIITNIATTLADVGSGTTGTMTINNIDFTNLGYTYFKNITVNNGASLTIGTPINYNSGQLYSSGGTIAVNGTLNLYSFTNGITSSFTIGTTGTSGVAGTLNVYNTLETTSSVTLTRGNLNLDYKASVQNFRGYFKPNIISPGSYPTGGSGVGGAIKKGDYWVVSAVGFVSTASVLPMYSVTALVDNPTVDGDWSILSNTNYNFRFNRFISNSGLTRSITISGGSVLELFGTTSTPSTTYMWDVSNITNLSKIDAKDSIILLTGEGSAATNAYISFHGGDNITGTISSPVTANANIKYGYVIFNKTNSTTNTYIYGSSLFQNFSDFGAINNPTLAGHTLSIEGGSINIFDGFNVNGATSVAAQKITLNSTSGTLPHNLISTGAAIQAYYLNIKNSNASPVSPAKWFAVEGTDQGGNTGWVFQTVTRYWVGGGLTKNWTDTYNWSDVSGGAPPASVPTNLISAVFDSNSGNGVCNINTNPASCLNFDCEDFAGTFSRTTGILYIYGNAILGTSFATLPNYTGGYTYTRFYCTDSTVTNTIKYLGGPSQKMITSLQFYGPGKWQMISPLYTTGGASLYSGTLDTGGYDIIADNFAYSPIGSLYNIATLNLNNSTITLTGITETWDLNGAVGTTNFTLNAGGSTIEMNNNTGNAAGDYVRFYGGGKIYNKVKFNRANNTARNYLGGSAPYFISEFSDLGTASHTIYFGTNAEFTFGNIILNSTINPSSTNIVTFTREGGTNNYIFHSTNDYKINCKNVTVNYCTADTCKFIATGTFILTNGTTGWNSTSCGSGTLLITGVGQ